MLKRIGLLSIVILVVAMAILPFTAFAGAPVGVRQVTVADAGNYEVFPVEGVADVTVKPAPGPDEVAFGGVLVIPGGTSVFKYISMNNRRDLLPQLKLYARDANNMWRQTPVTAAHIYRQYGIGFEGGKTTWQVIMKSADLGWIASGAKISVSWGVGPNKLTQEWDYTGANKGNMNLTYIGLP